MAAAILMMNMQGAVMAADKDQTIFRYSDKVPFALMTDPNSSLPWADIWNEFRINTNLSKCDLQLFEEYLNNILPNMQVDFPERLSFVFTMIQKAYFLLLTTWKYEW